MNAVNDTPAVQYMSNGRQTGAQQLSAISRG
jgi:hypothetical protein